MLGILRRGTSPAATLLTEAGFSVEAVRSELQQLAAQGLTPPLRSDADALDAIGIDIGQIRRQLEASFGADAVRGHLAGAAASVVAGRQPPAHPAVRQAGALQAGDRAGEAVRGRA
jgi:hypothetical protein